MLFCDSTLTYGLMSGSDPELCLPRLAGVTLRWLNHGKRSVAMPIRVAHVSVLGCCSWHAYPKEKSFGRLYIEDSIACINAQQSCGVLQSPA